MKILFVITGLGVGGAEHMVLNLAHQLVNTGHHVEIAYLKGQPQLKPHPSIHLTNLGLTNVWALPQALKRLKQRIQQGQFDVVHAHLFHAILMSRCVRVFTPFYLISTAHSKDIGGQFRAYLYRFTDRWSDLNTNVSQEATQHFIEQHAFSTDKSKTVVNGIDTNHFCFSESDRYMMRTLHHIGSEKVCIAIGRFNTAKDYPNLIHAFKQVHAKHRAVKLYIIGDGILRSEIEQLIIDLNLSEVIFLMGVQHNIVQWLNMSDLLILSSAWEGFGLVVAEAMSCERVVIATDCGGVKEVVGDTDFLVPPQQSQQLADKINTILNFTEQQYTDIGKRHRTRIQTDYSATTSFQNWLSHYQFGIKQGEQT